MRKQKYAYQCISYFDQRFVFYQSASILCRLGLDLVAGLAKKYVGFVWTQCLATRAIVFVLARLLCFPVGFGFGNDASPYLFKHLASLPPCNFVWTR